MKISFPLAYAILLLNILISFIAGPIYPVFLGVIISILGLMIGKAIGIIKKTEKGDFIKCVGITLAYIILFIILGYLAITFVPFWKLVLVGLLIDIISFGIGWLIPIPIVSDVLGGIIAIIICLALVPGIFGFILAAIAAIISMIPFIEKVFIPITISFILLKIITLIIGGIFGGMI